MSAYYKGGIQWELIFFIKWKNEVKIWSEKKEVKILKWKFEVKKKEVDLKWKNEVKKMKWTIMKWKEF